MGRVGGYVPSPSLYVGRGIGGLCGESVGKELEGGDGGWGGKGGLVLDSDSSW